MTAEIILVFVILVVVIGVLVTELMPLEVLAMLVLGVLAITGLVSPLEALAGFSNPAVVTIWAVFILSGGLTRTGIANILGRYLLKMVGTGEARLVILIMLIAGGLSAFMNNVAVAALMLPVVMDIARKTGHAPSRILMPLAYGSLLGGLTTMIGTPPNILVSEALRTNGLTPFGLFDFTPVGLFVMVGGILFVTFFCLRLLPDSSTQNTGRTSEKHVLARYNIQERLFRILVPQKSALIGKTLVMSDLGARLDLNVIGITRGLQTILAPEITERIQAGDELIVEGRFDRIEEMRNWGQLLTENPDPELVCLQCFSMEVAKVQLAPNSPWSSKNLSDLNFRSNFGLNVLAVVRAGRKIDHNVKSLPLREDDTLVVHGPIANIDRFASEEGVLAPVVLAKEDVVDGYMHDQRVRLLTVAENSKLAGLTVAESRLGDALDIQILAIVREDGTALVPTPDAELEGGDRLLISGMSDLAAALLLHGLDAVFDSSQLEAVDLSVLENDQVGPVEVILSPYSALSGQTLEEISFREKFGLTVLAVLRKGRVIRTGLRSLRLEFGDALLLFGTWKKLAVLGREPDFVVLTEEMQEVAREEKAKTALVIMAAVLVPVMLGFVPIYIAVVIGAALMVLTRCLTMDEAYRYIEWKAVFLIAGMLPLGVALDKTGAASLVAEQVINLLGPFGPYGILFGLLAITFAATSIIPTAALVVLMVPIALKTSAGLGISPYPLMMGIAMAASSSFTSPISHPANVLVMGPGGYKFMDYVKVGVPLTLVIFAILMVVIPLFWPLTG